MYFASLKSNFLFPNIIWYFTDPSFLSHYIINNPGKTELAAFSVSTCIVDTPGEKQKQKHYHAD